MATYDFIITSVMSIDKPTMKGYDPNIRFVTFRNLDCIEYKGPSREFHNYISTCVSRHEVYDKIGASYYSVGMIILPETIRYFEEAIEPQMLKCRLRVTNTREKLGNQLVPATQFKFYVKDVVSVYEKEELKNLTKSFTINRVVEIRKAKTGNPDDNKLLIFFERDEDGEPKIDIYSEDHDTISAINKKLKKSSSTHRYYLVVEASGKVTEPHCKNGFFTVDGYVKDNKDIVITSYEEVNLREEKDMRKNDATVGDVYNSMSVYQQKVCQFMIAEALKNAIKHFTPDSIKKVIYNDPATIIFWSDGTKTVVKCMEDEDYDPEKGFMAAVTKKVFGDKYGWVLRHHVKPAIEHEKEVDALMDSIAETLHRKRTAKESAICIRDQMMLSGATNWELETFDRFVRKYISKKEER